MFYSHVNEIIVFKAERISGMSTLENTKGCVGLALCALVTVLQGFRGRDSYRVRGGHPVMDAGNLRTDEARDRAERSGRSGRPDVTSGPRNVR